MKIPTLGLLALIPLVVGGAPCAASGADISAFLIDEREEIALARSAGPESVSDEAAILVLTPDGYRTAVEGTNGFTCLVLRSWDGPSSERSEERFYNPKIRAPICFNPAASQSILRVHQRRTELVAGGRAFADVKTTLAKELGSGALRYAGDDLGVAYMFSSAQWLGPAGKWRPHVMIYAPTMTNADAGGEILGEHPFVLPSGGNEPPVLTIPVENFIDPKQP